MRRRADWPERLMAYLDGIGRRPFAWGTWDCALFVAGAIEAMTGDDPAAALRGQYDDALGARRVLIERLGVWDMTGLFDRHCERVVPALAQRGDLTVVRGCGAVVLDARRVAVLLAGRDRIGFVPIGERAWRVG